MTFKKAEMAKTLKNGLCMIETNIFPTQLVGFCDFVGVDIAPVSKKTAVKVDSFDFLAASDVGNFKLKDLLINLFYQLSLSSFSKKAKALKTFTGPGVEFFQNMFFLKNHAISCHLETKQIQL